MMTISLKNHEDLFKENEEDKEQEWIWTSKKKRNKKFTLYTHFKIELRR